MNAAAGKPIHLWYKSSHAKFDKRGKCASERSLSIAISKRKKFLTSILWKSAATSQSLKYGRGTFCSKISKILSTYWMYLRQTLYSQSHSEPLSFKTKNFSFLEANLFIYVSPAMGTLYNFDGIVIVMCMKYSTFHL